MIALYGALWAGAAAASEWSLQAAQGELALNLWAGAWSALWLVLGLLWLVPLGQLWRLPSGPVSRRGGLTAVALIIVVLGLLIAHQAAHLERLRTLARFQHHALQVQQALDAGSVEAGDLLAASQALARAAQVDPWARWGQAQPLKGLQLSVQKVDGARVGEAEPGPAVLVNHADPWAVPAAQWWSGTAPQQFHVSLTGSSEFWIENAPTWPPAVLLGALVIGILSNVLLVVASGRRLAMQAELEHRALEVHQCLLMLEDTVLGYRQQSEQLQLVLRSTPAGFAAFDAEHRAVFVNPALANMLNCSAAELLNLDRSGFVARLSDMAPGDALALSRLLLGVRPASEPAPLRVALVLGGAAERVLEFSCSRVDGEMVQLVCSVVDVSESVRLEHSKSQFLANAAHEIRTPLTSILGYAQLLASRPSLSVEVRGRMQQEVVNKAQELSALLGNMLDLAELESDSHGSAHLTPVELNSTLAEGLEQLTTPEGAASIQWQACSVPLSVRAHPGRLQLLLRHLVSNAWSFSPPGSPVQVRLVLQADDSPQPQAMLEVEDQGCGMNPEELSRVFERFWRADESGARPGFGLGLCIVREIVRQLHGHIELHSQPGQGTRVRVTLPLLSVGALADAA
ncbi:ATP-binding protein [Ideonella sp.]|uniref:sensor histidine kinase n=1 Tax=Ideonella sp. TaxID=1929293 RepID=UPI003BB7D840